MAYFSQFPTIPYDSKGTGEFKDVKEAQKSMTSTDKIYMPIKKNHDVYTFLCIHVHLFLLCVSVVSFTRFVKNI